MGSFKEDTDALERGLEFMQKLKSKDDDCGKRKPMTFDQIKDLFGELDPVVIEIVTAVEKHHGIGGW
jgi:hypothetical protein